MRDISRRSERDLANRLGHALGVDSSTPTGLGQFFGLRPDPFQPSQWWGRPLGLGAWMQTVQPPALPKFSSVRREAVSGAMRASARPQAPTVLPPNQGAVRPTSPAEGNACFERLRLPSTAMMTEATMGALSSVRDGGVSAPLTSEFARLARMPNVRIGEWKSVPSTHSAQAYEHELVKSGKAVKVYVGDRNFAGANTATITDPTSSIGHFAAWPSFKIGMPVNARNAAVYLAWKACQRAGR